MLHNQSVGPCISAVFVAWSLHLFGWISHLDQLPLKSHVASYLSSNYCIGCGLLSPLSGAVILCLVVNWTGI